MTVYLKLFYVFFKVGLFSFGGGYAMLPLIYQEVQTLNLMPAEEFSNVVGLSQITPGPIAVNAATYVGFQSAGFWGALVATLGVSLPCFILILMIEAFMNRFRNNPAVQGILEGIRPATVGMIFSAAIFFGQTSLFGPKLFSSELFIHPWRQIHLPALAIFALTILGNKRWHLDPILLTVLAGIAGALIF